jgi:hypothetical protein
MVLQSTFFFIFFTKNFLNEFFDVARVALKIQKWSQEEYGPVLSRELYPLEQKVIFQVSITDKGTMAQMG